MIRRIQDIDTDPLADLVDSETRPIVRHNPGDASPDAPASDIASIHPILDDIVIHADTAVLPDPLAGIIVVGGPGKDVIKGTEGDDLIGGGAGDDIIRGAGGNDSLFGHDGNDILDGGTGDDWLVGDANIAGNDVLKGEAGDDTLEGRGGNDRLDGGTGNDYLLGGDGNDSLVGGEGNDYLSGGAGNDVLKGGDYSDYLNGGDGNDRLEGGHGRDTLTGGEGRDFFVASLAGDVWHSHHVSPDTVTDFNPLGSVRDCVDLSQVLDLTLFTGTTVQQAHDQGFFYLEQRGNPGEAGFGTYVVIDYNGSAPDTVHDMGNIRVFDLLGVAENQLGFTTFASHFIV